MRKVIQNSFTRGQLDYELMGRQDVDIYRRGASKLENFTLIRKQGGISKRPGTDMVFDLTSLTYLEKSGDSWVDANVTVNTKIRLIPFSYRKNCGMVLLLVQGKMYVFETTPVNGTIVRNYTVVNETEENYLADEIPEIDYVQSGDTIFIAHQNHPPAKIEHTYEQNDSGEWQHNFTYSKCEFNSCLDEKWKARVTDATVEKVKVTTVKGTYTEKYRASCVVDDKEYAPSDVYENPNCQDTDIDSYSGTTYHLPWTDSQVIRVDVLPNEDKEHPGQVRQFPDKVRLYKKSFNHFGLIAEENLSNYSDAPVSANAVSTNGTVLQDSGEATKDNLQMLEDMLDNASRNQTTYGIKADKSGSYGGLTLTSDSQGNRYQRIHLANAVNGMTLKIGLGVITKNSSNRWVFTANRAASITVQYSTDGGANWKDDHKLALPTASNITADSGETLEDFYGRIDAVAYVEDRFVAKAKSADWRLKTARYFTANSIRFSTGTLENGIEFVDKYITPDASITPVDTDAGLIMASDGDYPASVAISQQRLVWASTKNDPARVFMSEVGDFYSYHPHESMVADDPIDFKLPITKFARINHIAEMRKLLMFNSACEWMVDSASSVQGMTYETIQAYPQSYEGSADRIKPLVIGNAVLFPNRGCQAVRRFAWDLSNDGFAGKDVSVFSYSIFKDNPIKDWTYRQFPSNEVWCVLADGTLATLCIMEEQDIIAWMKHTLGGEGQAVAIASTSAMAPALDELQQLSDRDDSPEYNNASHDEVFVAVKRGSALTLERLRVQSKSTDSVYHSLCLDSMRVVGKWGVGELRAQDGAITWVRKNGSQTTTSRNTAIGWKNSDGLVYEGYPYAAKYVSVFPVCGNREVGAGQFDIKDICNVGFRLIASTGGKVGAYCENESMIRYEPLRYDDNKDDERTRQTTSVPDPENPAATVPGFVFRNCDCANVKPYGLNTRDGRVIVVQDEPWPFTLAMYEMDVATEKERADGEI